MDDERKTAYGIICKVCGQDKEPYQFFIYSGKYDREFFVTGHQPGACWECAGPYRCVVCHEVKPASEYRPQGRICNSCKQARLDFVAPQKRAEIEQPLSEVENDENSALEGFEE